MQSEPLYMSKTLTPGRYLPNPQGFGQGKVKTRGRGRRSCKDTAHGPVHPYGSCRHDHGSRPGALPFITAGLLYNWDGSYTPVVATS